MESQQLYIEDLKEIRDDDLLQLVGFKLGDEEYAIDVLKIQEIIRLVEITSVPRTDSYIMGVMNLRGKVIPVVDLRVRFNLDKSDFDKRTRIIVVRFEKENIGFVVDEVTQVVRINKSMIENTPPLVGTIGQEYILGICKYNDRLIILLDIDSLIYENKGSESELKKKFRSSPVKGSGEGSSGKDVVENEQPAAVSVEEVEKSSSAESVDFIIESSEKSKQDEKPKQISDDIDSLIAMELAKREKETEELNKKKKSVQQESIEDILNDAVRQAEEKINHNADHIDQNDLDALIAMELAKREAETEEMVRRKKEAEKKNEFLDASELEKQDNNNEEIADLKKTEDDGNNLIVKVDSVSEIRELAKKIIKGEERDISIDVKGELGEIIRLIQSTKDKVDSLEPSLELSSQNVPNVTKTLEYVNSTTEEAAANLIQYCDDLTSIYSELSEHFRDVEKYIENGNKDMSLSKIEIIDSLVSKAEEIGFNILQALEFQDITEQKINKVIKNVEEIGARLGAILGYVVASGSIVDETGTSSQDDIDKLLSDFGLN